MKKWMSLVTVSMLSTLVLAGCATDDAENETVDTAAETETTDTTAETETSDTSSTEAASDEETVTASIVLQEEGEVIQGTEQEVEVEEGTTLLEAMQENYDVEEEEGFISSIEGYAQNNDEEKWWLFDVNGEMATAGAADTVLNDGDEIVWNLGGM